MLLRRTGAVAAAVTVDGVSGITTTIFHQFSTRISNSNSPKLSRIPWKHRRRVLRESQRALTDYLHTTRSLPYLYADYIARNSPHSLSEIVSKIPFSPSAFLDNFRRYLRYNPINELEFFFESIGLIGAENEIPPSVLPRNTVFLSDWKHFNVACTLATLGFPWRKLGLLCKYECSVFEIDPSELQRKISEITDGYGFNMISLISICLTFPQVLIGKMDGLLSDLKMLDHAFLSSVDGNIDSVFELCEKIRMFHDLGCEMEKIIELMGRCKHSLVECSKEVLVSKIDYFSKLNVSKDQIGLLLLSRPEIFGFDLEDRVISVSGFLNQLGLRGNDLKSLKQKYPHVFGRNRIANLPNAMRSMDLGEWFFEKMKNGYHSLLHSYTIRRIDEDLDKHYTENVRKLHTKRSHVHVLKKLSFLHAIGFGENVYTVKALARLKGSGSKLQQRFDCLLRWGIDYSTLCMITRFHAEIFNQAQTTLEDKLEFLCTEMGSLQYLNVFPAFLHYSLENRIKPRYILHKWLVDQGLCKKEYSISTIIASSEPAFVARISQIHPPSATKWLKNSLEKESREGSPKKSAP